MLWSRIALVVALLTLLGACKRESAPGNSLPGPDAVSVVNDLTQENLSDWEALAPPEPQDIGHTPKMEPKASPGERESLDQKIERLLDEATRKSTCNRVSGCPAAQQLISIGVPAIEPIVRRYLTLDRPGFEKFNLLDVLGRIGGDGAHRFLFERLHEEHWEERAQAAISLGRLKATEYASHMEQLLVEARGQGRLGVQYALLCGLSLMQQGDHLPELRTALEPHNVSGLNWGFTRVAVECLDDLSDKTSCPLLASAILHPDLFLKKAAIKMAGNQRCSQPEVLDALGQSLDDRVPSVRRLAQSSLQSITGTRFQNKKAFDDYRAFQEKTP